MRNTIMTLSNVKKSFNTDGRQFTALLDVSLTVQQREFIGIVGRSGSGKTTLLNMMSGIDRPTEGRIVVDGASIQDLGQSELDDWRGRTVGLVFQFFQLIPTLTVEENIMLPMDFCDVFPANERHRRALELLDSVGLADKAIRFPAVLSGGEKQKVAIARSMANDPPLILADEPTGNLDSASAEIVFNLFEKLNRMGKTVVIVSHDASLRHYAERTVELFDGRIESHARIREEEPHA